MEDLIENKTADYVVILPQDNTLENTMAKLATSGIPYVMFDRIIDSAASTAVACVKGDNNGIGAETAKRFIADGMKAGDKVLIMPGDNSSVPTMRNDGFFSVLKENGWTEEQIAAIQSTDYTGWSRSKGKELFIKKDGTYSFSYDVNDEVVLGDTEPKLEGVIGTTFYYKGLSVGCYFRYSLGAQIFNSALFQKVENIGTADVFNNQDKRALYDRWSPNNTEAYFKGISLTQKTDKSSRFVMDENYISGESFSIGYEFTQSFVRKLGLSALSVQANMNDAFRISSVKNERGIDYPFARTISFSVAATF